MACAPIAARTARIALEVAVDVVARARLVDRAEVRVVDLPPASHHRPGGTGVLPGDAAAELRPPVAAVVPGIAAQSETGHDGGLRGGGPDREGDGRDGHRGGRHCRGSKEAPARGMAIHQTGDPLDERAAQTRPPIRSWGAQAPSRRREHPAVGLKPKSWNVSTKPPAAALNQARDGTCCLVDPGRTGRGGPQAAQ